MTKGSVRKKGRKKDSRFYAKDITLGQLLDLWAEESLQTGTLSNGTVENYLQTISRIRQHQIASRRLKTITPEHLQQFVDLLTFGGREGDFVSKGYSRNYIHSFTAVLNQALCFAVFPRKYLTSNPMQYVVLREQPNSRNLFAANDGVEVSAQPLTPELYATLIAYLRQHNTPAVLPVQIAYFTGLRIGEVCGLTWQDIHLDEQYLTVRRSVGYNGATHKMEIGPTKRGKIRTVDFCNTLARILQEARAKQCNAAIQYGTLWQQNYYREIHGKNRTHYELYHLDGTQAVPSDYTVLSLVCLRDNGAYESPNTLSLVCKRVRRTLPGFEGFHFHVLRHTYTTNLLSRGARPKDVQELLGHSDVRTTMNIYAHASRESKRRAAMLLEQIL